ncbi:zinc-ribbon domain-containing protein [Alistipes finegoldii]|uniref:zinc-ribbon domain-containing protein n=1 Tax=Alistipes finegoldii TaxID=214856 RepID=UPI00242DE0BA|nr:zinc-ribbon domain-containing protein [Alistipes finegoldii]
MKCQNCNSELLEGAKFCTTCGTPVAAQPAGGVCGKCGARLLPGAKFCTTCGAPAAAAPESAPAPEAQAAEGGELAAVKQKIFWNIQKGEVACRVNESEFVSYDSAQGLIVNDGTTAYIKANGKVLAEIHGGIYDFVDPDELERILESRRGGAAGALAGGGRFLINALLGRRVKDEFDKSGDPERQRSLDAVIESMKRHEAFSLTLKLDKSFSLVFGSGTAEEMAEFKPMTVRTKLLDLQMGLRAIFRISDFDRFAEYFLTDERVATTLKIAGKLQPTIQNAVQAVMQDREVEGTSIPADVVELITAKIVAAGDQFYGLTLERVAEVAASNEDLERLRSLSRELYLSEQELDFLRRTNDFRNRLATETNGQAIADARSDLQLYQGLQEVNKDRLLADDELDKFYTVLSREKRIRDAQSEDEVEAALSDIEKTGLLREEDVENLRIDIAERRYQRGQVIKLMQLKDEIEFEKVRTAGEGQIAVETMRQGLELQELTLAHRRREDEYSDDRRAKEREQMRADREAELELDDAEMNAQIERLRKVKEINREDKKMDLDHEREMERLKQEALDKKARMTAEQLMAVAAGENLDSQAAVKFAESFSAGKNVEQVQQAAEARIADSQRHEDRMLEMMREMKEMATTMTGHIVQNKDEERDRYRERMERQEERVDKTQDSALEYATRNNQQAAPKPQPQAP